MDIWLVFLLCALSFIGGVLWYRYTLTKNPEKLTSILSRYDSLTGNGGEKLKEILATIKAKTGR